MPNKQPFYHLVRIQFPDYIEIAPAAVGLLLGQYFALRGYVRGSLEVDCPSLVEGNLEGETDVLFTATREVGPLEVEAAMARVFGRLVSVTHVSAEPGDPADLL